MGEIRVCPACQGHNSDCPHCGGGGADDARRGLNVIGSLLKPPSVGLTSAEFKKHKIQNELSKKESEIDNEREKAEPLKLIQKKVTEEAINERKRKESTKLQRREKAKKKRKLAESNRIKKLEEAKRRHELSEGASMERHEKARMEQKRLEREWLKKIKEARKEKKQLEIERLEETDRLSEELVQQERNRINDTSASADECQLRQDEGSGLRQQKWFGRIVDGTEPIEKPLHWMERFKRWLIK